MSYHEFSLESYEEIDRIPEFGRDAFRRSLGHETDVAEKESPLKILQRKNMELEKENLRLQVKVKRVMEKIEAMQEFEHRLNQTQLNLAQRRKELKERELLVADMLEEKSRADERRRNEEESFLLAQKLQAEEDAKRMAKEAASAELAETAKLNCIICLRPVESSQIFWYDGCDHADTHLCLSCMHHYCRNAVTEGKTEIGCPVESCSNTIGYDAVSFLLQDRKLMAKYDEFLYAKALEGMEDISYCPNKKCANPTPRRGVEDMVTCIKCKMEFCFKCREEWHTGVSCAEYQKWKELHHGETDDNIKFMIWAKKNGTRKCPGGHDCIKVDGCDHMHCPKCNVEWCWRCSKAYVNGAHPRDGCSEEYGDYTDEEEYDSDY